MAKPSPRRRSEGLIPMRADSPAGQRGYSVGYTNYNDFTPNECARLQSELEREQRRRHAAEKSVRELTRRFRRLEDKDAMDRQSIDKLKWKIRDQQTFIRDLLFQTKQKDEYISRLQHDGEGLRRRLSEVASGLPQSLEQEFLQLRNENKRLQHKSRNLMVAFEEERLHRDREVQELLDELRLAAHQQRLLMVDLDRSERQVHKMMDWMHSMKEEVLELKKAQEEEIRSGALSPAVSITSIPNFVQMLEQSNPFQKAEDLLDMMKSYRPNDAATDAASDIQSIPTEQLDVWSFADQSEESDDGGWPTFDEDAGSSRRTSRNIEDRLAYVDDLLETDEQQAEVDAQEGLLDFRLLRLHDDQVLFDAVRKNLAQIRQRKQIKMPDHRTRKSVLDFASQGGYHRYGAEEEEALRAFDFLDRILVNGQEDEDAAEANAASSMSTVLAEETYLMHSPLPPASIASPVTNKPITGFAFNGNEEDTKRSSAQRTQNSPVHKISPVDGFGKATTPELSQLRKLVISDRVDPAPPTSIYGTPGTRKKVIVRASSMLVDDVKDNTTKKKPNNMVRAESVIPTVLLPAMSDTDTQELSPQDTAVDTPKARSRTKSEGQGPHSSVFNQSETKHSGFVGKFIGNRRRKQSAPAPPPRHMITTEL